MAKQRSNRPAFLVKLFLCAVAANLGLHLATVIAEPVAPAVANASTLCLNTFGAPTYYREESRSRAKTVPWTKLSMTATPTPAVRHHSLDCLDALPTAPVAVELDCLVDPVFKELTNCLPTAPTSPKLLQAALYQAGAYRFDLSRTSRQRYPDLKTRVVVRLDAADRIAISRPTDVTPLKVSEVIWTVPVGSIEWSRYYPDRAARLETSARAKFTCQIRPDLSLLCTEAVISSTDPNQFRVGAQVIESFVRAAPTLTDGTPSVGRWVTFHLSFTPPP